MPIIIIYYILFKACALNYEFYCWFACIEGLKIADKLHARGLSYCLDCCLCKAAVESHQHLIFDCPFSMKQLKNILPYGDFFLIHANLFQILEYIDSLDHYILTNICALALDVSVYMIWKEMNSRFHNNPSKSMTVIKDYIKKVMSFKMKRWKVKDNWPTYVIGIFRNFSLYAM